MWSFGHIKKKSPSFLSFLSLRLLAMTSFALQASASYPFAFLLKLTSAVWQLRGAPIDPLLTKPYEHHSPGRENT